MRSMRALQNALSQAGSHCRGGSWGHLSRSPLLGWGVRHHLSKAAAQSRETPHSRQPLHQDLDSSESGMLSRLADLLFYTIAEGQERIPIHKFTTALKATGLQTSDPRLRDCVSQMRRMVRESGSGGLLDRDLFRKWQLTSLSWPSQTQTCGAHPCALWTVSGTLWAIPRSPSACSPV
nr:glutaminase liver isoform, mitochondrial-like [Loxodonta africana]